MKPKIKDSTVLITGASSGMGKEIATQLASDANQIILVARNVKNLKSLQKITNTHTRLNKTRYNNVAQHFFKQTLGVYTHIGEAK